MKRQTSFLSLSLILFALLALLTISRAFTQEATGNSPVTAAGNRPNAPIASDGAMSSRPIPSRPIPYHEAGHPSRAANYSTLVTSVNAEGVAETAQLTGLDALLADDVIDDPLAGNYRILGLDKIFWGSYSLDYNLEAPNSLELETFAWLTPTLVIITGTETSMGDHRYFEITAGDLNRDYYDEQITAWVDTLDSNRIHLSISQMPGLPGVTSAPAAVKDSAAQLYDLARGYDDALWVDDSGGWQDGAGGRLLSAPAAVSRAAGEYDVFAVGLDNDEQPPNYLVNWHNRWNGTTWVGWEQLDDPADGWWPVLEQDLPTPELPAPAVVANGNQLDLFWLGPDNTLRWRHFDGANWGNWQNQGGMLASGPGAVAHDGQIDVFARGADDALWMRSINGSWGAWQRVDRPGMPITVTMASAPAAVSPATGQVRILALGSDGGLWQLAYNGSSWGDWQAVDRPGMPAGTTLASAPAAVSPATGQVRITVRGSDGALWQLDFNGSSWGSWASLNGLEVQHDYTLIYAQTITPSSAAHDYHNGLLDVATGHFMGDGREQIVLAYQSATGIDLGLYDIVQNGFEPVMLATTAGPVNGTFPRVATADVDGDGLDEIGLVYIVDSQHYAIRIYKLTGDSTSGYALTTFHADLAPHYCCDNGYYFAGALRIEGGDIISDTTFPGDDEFIVLTDWAQNTHNAAGWLSVRLSLYSYEPGNATFTDETDKQIWHNGDCDDPWCLRERGGFGLAVGDVDGVVELSGATSDEIVVTWPVGFRNAYWLDLIREVAVYQWYDAIDPNTARTRQVPGYNQFSYLDTLAVGDLDQDLKAEIVLATHSEGAGLTVTGYHLDVYDWATLESGPLDQYDLGLALRQRGFNLAMGDFTDGGLRVGPPSYRVQNGMTSPEVFLNLPPMHRDIIYTSSQGNILLEFDNNATATHTTSTSTTEKSTVQSRRDWELSTGLETSVGGLGHTVSASLNNTYGEDFTKATTAISSTTYDDETTAALYDQVIFNVTHYAVWEYPVVGGEENNQDEPYAISVIYPLVEDTNPPATEQGRLCDEDFYDPTHQTYNVWSYDPIGTEDGFADFDHLLGKKQTAGGSNFSVEMYSGNLEDLSASFHNQISAGLEYIYENELNVPLIGNVWDFSFRAYANGSYGHENMSTLTSEYTEISEVSVEFPSSTYPNYTIVAYLYWAKAGYLVVDYQTRPDPGDATWLYYNKADPAFLLPWYGFPDVNGNFPPPGPHCTFDKQLFSHDIELDPAYVQNGETLTMTATVRNFSNVSRNNVKVNFYLGDPAAASPIGTCSIPVLNRSLGPQSCEDTWVVTGASGEERIYAVIDPDHAFDVMHDENDVINNNIGYGLLHVAGADYFDPGLRQKQAYQSILFQDAPGLGFGLYLPTMNITETVRFEVVLTDSFSLRPIVGNPIAVQAFPGGEGVPVEEYSFGQIPAALMAFYRNSDLLPGMNEDNLRLYRLQGSEWVDATCPGYAIAHFPEDNRLSVPVCQTGIFALSDQTPQPFYEAFLPTIER